MLTFKPHKSTLWGTSQEETRYHLFKDGNQLFHKNNKEVSIKFENLGLYLFHIEIFNNFLELCKLDDIIFNEDEVKQLELFFTEGKTYCSEQHILHAYKFRTYRHLKDYLEKMPDYYLDMPINIKGVDSSHGLLITKINDEVIICNTKIKD